jgi:hypothetical protein
VLMSELAASRMACRIDADDSLSPGHPDYASPMTAVPLIAADSLQCPGRQSRAKADILCYGGSMTRSTAPDRAVGRCQLPIRLQALEVARVMVSLM